MANTSYQISIGADFKDAKGGLKELGVAIKEVETIAGGFAKRAEGLGNRLEAIFGSKLNQKLKNLGSNILLQSDKLAASSSPLSGAQLGSKLGSFRVKLENYGAQQSEIDALLSEFRQANVQAIKNFYEQVSLANREAIADAYKSALQDLDKATEYARKIVHDGKLDSAIHRDTRDVYSGLANFDIDKVELSDLYKITESLQEIRLHTAQVIQREIENLERDALAANRAIKAADITRVESHIGSYREVLGTGEVARLKDLLQNTVSSVAGELQVKSTQELLDAIQNAVENVALSSKQLKAQLDSFRVQGESLGIQGGVFDDFAEVKQLTARIQEVERQELLQFQKDTRKRITDNLREILQKTSVDLQQIRKLSTNFKQAGGTSDEFAKEGTHGILVELVARVREMKYKGAEFTRGLEKYYEDLFKAVGVQGAQLASLVGFVKAEASAVNSNAATMRMNAMRSEINKVLTSYNRVDEAISKAIMDKLRRDWASVSAESFEISFKPQLDAQKIISERNALVQKMEGIWKPFEKQLKDLEKLRSIDFSSYQSQLTEDLVGNLKNRLLAVTHAVSEQARAFNGNVDGKSSRLVLGEFDRILEQLSSDLDSKIYTGVKERLDSVALQLKGIDLNGTISLTGKEISAAKTTIDTALAAAEVKMDQAVINKANEAKNLLDSITLQLSKNDAISRAKSMIRNQARNLGGEAALRYDIEDTLNAAEELARAVERFDKQLANQLRNQASLIARRKVDPLYSGRGGKGGKADDPYGMNPNVIANYRRMLPMQMTDIFVGSLTGQRWHYILLQQGGQLKDMFGGIGNAVKEVGKYLLGLITPTNMFIAALAGGVATAGLLVKRANDIRREFREGNVLLEYGAGRSFDYSQIEEWGRKVADTYALTNRASRQFVMEFAANVKVPEGVLNKLFTDTNKLRDIQAAITGSADNSKLPDFFKRLSEAFTLDPNSKDGMEGIRNFLSEIALFDEPTKKVVANIIKTASASKDATEKVDALNKIFDILANESAGAAQKAMSDLQREVENARKAFNDAWDTLADNSAWDTLSININNALADFAKFANKAVTYIAQVMSKLGEIKAPSLSDLPDAMTYPTNIFGPNGSGDTKGRGSRSVSGKVGGVQPQIHTVTVPSQWEMSLIASGGAALKTIGQNVSKIAKGSFSKNPDGTPRGARTPMGREESTNTRGGGGRRGGGRSRTSDAQKELEAQQKIVQQLKEEYDQRSKMGKLAGLEYDRQHGKIKLEGIYLDQARELARLIDERALAEERETLAAQRKVQLLEHEISLQKELVNAQIETFRLTGSDRTADYASEILNRQLELQGKIRKIEQDLVRKIERARKDQKSDAHIAMLRDEAAKEIELTKKVAEENLEVWKKYYEERERLEKDWQAGYKKGVSQVIDWIYEIRSETASAVENWASGMADAIAKFARTGKLSFKDLANSILDDIARIASRQFVSALFGGFQQGWGVVPKAENGVSELLKGMVKSQEVQKVFVVNQGFSELSKIPSSFSDIASTVKEGFQLGSGGKFNLGSDPWGFGGAADKTAEAVAREVSPAIKEGSKSMFGSLFDKIGGLFSNVLSGIGNLFNRIQLPSFGGGGGGFFSSLFSGIGNFFKGLFGFSTGGYTGPGGKYTPAGIVHAGEFVINAASTRRLGLDFLNKLNGYADGGYVSPTPSIVNSSNLTKDMAGGLEVNIYNQTDSKITAQRNSAGGLDIFVEQAINGVAANIAAGGAVAAALQRTYSLNRGVGVQRTGY